MKAVIVDIKGNSAVALTKSGRFIKIRNNGNLCIGYETDIKAGITSINTMAKVVSIAAALIFIMGLGTFAYKTPYNYIDIDINPSIEVTTNVFNRIIGVKALNIDAEKILDTASCKNKNVQDGIGSIIKSAVSNGYLKNTDTSAIMFTVASKDEKKADKIENMVKSSAAKELSAVNVKPEVVVEKVTVKKHDEAFRQGISPGKLTLIQKAIDLNPELKVDDLKDKPVKEILKLINDGKKSNPDELKQNTPKNTPVKQNKNTEPPKDKSDKKVNAKEGSTGTKEKNNINNKDNIKDTRTDNSKKGSSITDSKGKEKESSNDKSNQKYNNHNSNNKTKPDTHHDDNNDKKSGTGQDDNNSEKYKDTTDGKAKPHVSIKEFSKNQNNNSKNNAEKKTNSNRKPD